MQCQPLFDTNEYDKQKPIEKKNRTHTHRLQQTTNSSFEMISTANQIRKYQMKNAANEWGKKKQQQQPTRPTNTYIYTFGLHRNRTNTVSPMIFVPNQLVGAPAGTDVTIDCNTEAHPKYIKNPFYLIFFSHKFQSILYFISLISYIDDVVVVLSRRSVFNESSFFFHSCIWCLCFHFYIHIFIC